MTAGYLRHIVYCNGASAEVHREKDEPEPLVLDYLTDSRVRIQLPDFVRSIGSIPPRVLDLIEIAAYIFCADRLTSRGQRDSLVYDSWSRQFHFVIKVRDESFWCRDTTIEKLSNLLLFITGDREYQFQFMSGHSTNPTHLFEGGVPGRASKASSRHVVFRGVRFSGWRD